MYPTPNQLLELQRTHVDAMQALGTTLFQATEKLATLNLAATRNFLNESAAAAQTLLSAKDPQELAAIAGTLAQPGAEKFVSYSRGAYTIASAAGAELSKIVETQMAEGSRKLGEAIDAASHAAPAGSEPAISFIKSSFAAANSAFDAVTKATRAATESAESNIAAAVAVATDAVKGKAKKAA
jgi:phasin family protein